MEIENGGAREGVLVPVPVSSETFDSHILPPLQNSYMYEESKQSFRYSSASLINNASLQEQYEAFRTKRRDMGYSEEEMEESYGFLLFEDKDKANKLGETGIVTGHSTCSTLGDPSKGVYVSKFSDCLDLNRWYHGKSGHIAIIRLTKGRVREVTENYTNNFTSPSVGYDCHVSEQLTAVSANTSSFLAFERTQFYMYELLGGGNDTVAQSPSHACPFAIVAFSYGDTKAPTSELQEKSEEEKTVFHYYPWKGQLQISSQVYHIGLKSSTGALIPAKLPTKMESCKAITMSDLRQVLPKAIFETCFSGEVSLDGMCCSLYELIPTEAGDTSLSLLTHELKEKDLALTIQLNDSGFLILLHSSHFLSYEDAGSNKPEVLQGMFVFPDSRTVPRETKIPQKKPSLSPEVIQVLPALNYAEIEAEKCPPDQSGELCGLLEQHIQSYAALIHPGLASSPSREASIFPDQYDVPDAVKYLYSAPKWTEGAWLRLQAYLHQPVSISSFQLSVSRAVELLAAGREERVDDPDDDVYYCLSSPEGAPRTPTSLCPEVQPEGESPSHADPAVYISNRPDVEVEDVGANLHLNKVQEEVPSDLSQPVVSTEGFGIPGTAVMTKPDCLAEITDVSTSPTSDDLPTELDIPNTPTERTAIVVVSVDESPDMINAESAIEHSGIQTSSLPPAKLQVEGASSPNGQCDRTNQPSDPPEVSQPCKSDWRKRPRRRRGKSKRVLRSSVVKVKEKEPDKEESVLLPRVHQLKQPRGHHGKCKRVLRSAVVKENEPDEKESVLLTQVLVKENEPDKNESVLLTQVHPLKKKTERWDLKAIITKCGRIFVPHGSDVIAKDIESLKDGGRAIDHEQCAEEMMVEASIQVPQPMDMGNGPGPTIEMEKRNGTLTKTMDGLNHPQNIQFIEDISKQTMLKKSDGNNDSPIEMSDTKDHSPEVNIAPADRKASQASEHMQKTDSDYISKEKHTKKRKYVAISLSKLKTVLSRGGKRKTSPPVSEDQMLPLATGTREPPHKISKADTGLEKLESVQLSNFNITSTDMNIGTDGVAKTLPLDPDLAKVLGLVPKKLQNEAQKNPEKVFQLRKETPSTLDQDRTQAMSDEMFQALPSTPSTTHLAGQLKPLKKLQRKSAESIKKKWWLHFYTPASYEKVAHPRSLQLKVCRNHSVRKSHCLKGGPSGACPPADGLTLLADLALSASIDKVLQQPDPAPERRLDPCLEISDGVKDGGSPESVLHALLRCPAARLKSSSKSPLPKGLVGSVELAVLISNEHSYSLPPSSSLPLGLSGALLQVSPLSSSEGLQQHRKDIYGDGTHALRAFLCQEDKNREEVGASEFLHKGVLRRHKFRRSCSIVEKDGSIQVTRLWKENYNFNLDSKFTNDPKDKMVTRALHGPWDFNIEDTNEQVQLIIHMWIGLFYSRSTARFFHTDASVPCMEDNDGAELANGMVPAMAPSETSSSAFAPSSKIPESEVLDHSNGGKKDAHLSNQRSEVLDLSMKKSSIDLTSDRKQTPVSHEESGTVKDLPVHKPASGLQNETSLNPYRSTEVELKGYRDSVDNMSDKTSEVDDDDERSSHENNTKSPLQKDGNLRHSNLKSLESDRSYILLCEQTANVYIQQENVMETQGSVQLMGKDILGLQKNERCDGEQNIISMSSKEVEMVQQVDDDSVKSKAYTEVQGNGDASDMSHTVEHENESRDGDHVASHDGTHDGNESKETHKADYNENDSAEAAPPEVHNGNVSINEEISAVHDDNLLKYEAQLANDEDHFTMHDGNVSKDEVQIAMQNGDVSKDEVQIAMQDGNVSKDEVQIAMQDGNGSNDEVQIAMQDGNVSKDEVQIAMHDGNGSKDEVQIAMQDGNVSKDEVQIAMQDGNGSKDEVQIAMQDGNVFKDEVQIAMQDGNGSKDEVQIAMQDGNGSKDEALPVVYNGNDSRDKTPAVLLDGNTSREDETIAVRDGNISVVEAPLTVCKEDDSRSKLLSAVQSENDSRDDPLPVQWDGNSSINVEPTAVQDGNGSIDEALPMVHGEDVSVDETPLEMHGERDSRDEALAKNVTLTVSDRNTLSVGEFNSAIHQSMNDALKENQSKVHFHSKICDRAILFAGEKLPILDLSDSNQKIVSKKSDTKNRCPTPTVDEVPYDYIPCPVSFEGLAICNNDGVSKAKTGKGQSRSSTPTQDELPFDQELCYDSQTLKTVLLPNSKDTKYHNLNSGLGLEKEQVQGNHELRCRSSLSSVDNELHKSSNNSYESNNLKTNPIISRVQTPDPSNKSMTTCQPPKLHSTSSKNENDFGADSSMDHTSAEQGLHTHTKSKCTLIEKAFSEQSRHPESPSIETETTCIEYCSKRCDSSDIYLERDVKTCDSVEPMQLEHQSIALVSDEAPSQDLLALNSNDPRPSNQRPIMAVKPSKSEDSRGEYICNEGQTDDPVTLDVVIEEQTDSPACSNTTVQSNSTPFAPVMMMRLNESPTRVSQDVIDSEEPAGDLDNIESNFKTNLICDDQHKVCKSNFNKTKLDYMNSLYKEWEKEKCDEDLDFSKTSTSSSSVSLHSEQHQQDWFKYCQAERSGKSVNSWMDMPEEDSPVTMSSIVTVLDHKGNRMTYENYPIVKQTKNMHTWTVHNLKRKGSSSPLEEFSQKWIQSDLTQSSMDQECLIYSEKMNQILKGSRKGMSHDKTTLFNRSKHCRSNVKSNFCSPVTVHFSSLQEHDSSEEHWEALPSLAGQKIKVDMPERKNMAEATNGEMPLHLQKLSYAKGNEMTHARISDMAVECAKSYQAMMNDVCAGKKLPSKTGGLKSDNTFPKSKASKHIDFCGQMKREMSDSLHDNLNSVVRQSCKIKFRFYILVTSADAFFKKTKDMLKAEGHSEVEPSRFCLNEDSPSSPLLIILRNEDIAEHICKIPHLLELKKSPSVLFAGIDRPDDVVNLTHQELFSRGGFVVFEGAALDALSLCNMKKIAGFLEELSKKGKWKWLLHYRDSRLLKENARSSAEAQDRKKFMDCCQEAGMVEILPYHECDVISRDRPNYLDCLVHLQVQNVSARFPVFITDTTADNAFGKHGILTMNINSFLLISQSDTCTVS